MRLGRYFAMVAAVGLAVIGQEALVTVFSVQYPTQNNGMSVEELMGVDVARELQLLNTSTAAADEVLAAHSNPVSQASIALVSQS